MMLAVHDLKRVSATVVMVLACALLVATPLILTGCLARRRDAPRGERDTVPPGWAAAARPADGVLTAGTEVTLAETSGSYTLVTLPDDRRAYVATDSLAELRIAHGPAAAVRCARTAHNPTDVHAMKVGLGVRLPNDSPVTEAIGRQILGIELAAD